MISYSLLRYDTTKVAQYRLEAIKFFEEFGLKATKKAFKVSKSTLYRWKKVLKDSLKKPRSSGVRRHGRPFLV